MCGRFLLFFLPVFFLAGVLPGQEARGNWYLITEAELRSIEQYRESCEGERRNWLLQVNELKDLAGSSQRESASLNRQLRTAREGQRELEKSFDKYAEGRLTAISLKNGEIAGLRGELADKTREAEKHKGEGKARLIMTIALGGAWVLYIGYRVLRFLKIIPV
jgi:hypothetical protein